MELCREVGAGVWRCCDCDLIVFQGKVGPSGPTGLKGEKVRLGCMSGTPGLLGREVGDAAGQRLGLI